MVDASETTTKAKQNLEDGLAELTEVIKLLKSELKDSRRAIETLMEKAKLSDLLLNTLPHPAMLVRRDRTILLSNQMAAKMGATPGKYCWQTFGNSQFIPEEDSRYMDEHDGSLPPGGTKCTFCRSDEAMDANKAVVVQVSAFERLWDTWWVPVDENTYLHYAIDVTERKQMEERILKALNESLQHQKEISALLDCSRTAIECSHFSDAAAAIFQSCKSLIGAKSGFVSLIDEKSSKTEDLFVDTGGQDCAVAPDLPISIGGLRKKACENGRPVVENDFSNSPSVHLLPAGHISLESVLIVPMLIKRKAVGLLAFADKPGGFDKDDSRLASAFAEFAAVALVNKRADEVLKRSKEILEKKVDQRTSELVLTNQRLQEQIEERLQAEEAQRCSEQQLRLLSARLLTAHEEERKRIARELHDSIGSSLTALKYRLEDVLQRNPDSKAIAGTFPALISLTQETIDESRRIMTDLRPSILDDLGIIVTIGWLCRQFQNHYKGVHIEKEIRIEESDVPERLKIVIFRIIQEALNNIAKYSQAESVWVSLVKRDSAIELRVRDNGVGFDPAGFFERNSGDRGIGLVGMKERSELSGGTFEITSTLGVGTRIRCFWPL